MADRRAGDDEYAARANPAAAVPAPIAFQANTGYLWTLDPDLGAVDRAWA
jgi:hypothetical protein